MVCDRNTGKFIMMRITEERSDAPSWSKRGLGESSYCKEKRILPV